MRADLQISLLAATAARRASGEPAWRLNANDSAAKRSNINLGALNRLIYDQPVSRDRSQNRVG